MIINNFDKKKIVDSFPNIKPFYEKNLHKKVNNNNNIYLIIPKGRKSFVWFTKYKGNNVCFFLNYNKKMRRYNNIEVCKCSFNSILTSGIGTIFYGTHLNLNERTFFNVESLYYYKGYNLVNEKEYNKLNYLENIINLNIKQRFYGKSSVVFGLSVISNNYDKIIKMLDKVSFKVYAIQQRSWKHNKCYYNERITQERDKYAVFKVTASIETDIYKLYYLNNGIIEYYSIADVPTYKDSTYLNSLFRNIKENYDLDDIEMSDDEEDFENVNSNKYLKKDVSYNMKCMYNYKFKKWRPIEISNRPIINKNQILFFEK